MWPVADILAAEGFSRIGQLGHDLDLSIWWHPEAKLQLIAVEVGGAVLLKGAKTYALTSIAEEGETWARDTGPFYDYLEAHFREAHVSVSWFRDVPLFLAERKARAAPAVAPADPSAAALPRRVRHAQAALDAAERLRQLDGGDSGILSRHLQTVEAQRRRELEMLQALEAQAAAESEMIGHLQREYRSKGSAFCLLFSISSNLQLARAPGEGRDAVRSIVKELRDADRFQVHQTLGGRLRIKAQETSAPALAWIEQWFGGSLNPQQLEQLRETSPGVADPLSRHTIVTPDEDIVADGSVIEHRKLLAARAFAAAFERLDHPQPVRFGTATPSGPILRPGRLVSAEGILGDSRDLSLRELGHVAISGRTGTGKSIAARVLVEELAQHESVSVLVVDPRNQAAGLLAPQDQPDLLDRYAEFGMGRARSFAFRYFAPATPGLGHLPTDLGDLAVGRNVLSLKGLPDEERCSMFQRSLEAVFQRLSASESSETRLVIVVEEAQLFMRRLVAEPAKKEAERAEAMLDTILREGRKYGLMAVVSSQSIKDFAREAAAIRQNATTKVFFGNSDREIEYVRDYLDDPRELVRLPPGVALVCNPAWGVLRVAFRPPCSKVWDFGAKETADLLRQPNEDPLSDDGARMLNLITRRFTEQGAGMNMSDAAREAGITSKRRLLAIVDELERTGRVRTVRLRDRGQPRILEPIASGPGGQNMDGTAGSADGSPHREATR